MNYHREMPRVEHKDWKSLIREVESTLQAIGMNLQGYKPTQSPSVAGDIRQKIGALEQLFQFIDSSNLPEKQIPRNMEIVQSLKDYLHELKQKLEAMECAVNPCRAMREISEAEKWFEQGKQLPTQEKQYDYFSDGFRKGESFHAWAWAGVGLAWLQKGNLDSAIDAFDKALAMDPSLPGITQQLQMTRAKVAGQPNALLETTPARQSAPVIPHPSPPTRDTSIFCPRCEKTFMIALAGPISTDGVIGSCPSCDWRFTPRYQRFFADLARSILRFNFQGIYDYTVDDSGAGRWQDKRADTPVHDINKLAEELMDKAIEDLLVSPAIMRHLWENPPMPVEFDLTLEFAARMLDRWFMVDPEVAGRRKAEEEQEERLLLDDEEEEEGAIVVTDLEDLSAEELAYYRETWGFDPVKDLVKRDEDYHDDQEVGNYYYEARLPLEHDPALKDAGVQLVARVELDADGDSRNRLGFTRGNERGFVECIHTAVYRATPAKLVKFSPEDYESLVRSTEGRPAILPPWEHFVSLKSFAAGLVARGVINTLFGLPAGSLSGDHSEDRNLEIQGWGENNIYYQLSNVLFDIAPAIVKPQMIERVGDIIEHAPEDWIRSHAEPLLLRYQIEVLFWNRAYLASVDDATMKKLLILFLTAYRGEFKERVSRHTAPFFDQFSEGNAVEDLDLDTTQNMLSVICNEKIQKYSDHYKALLDGILGKIFRKLFAREDPRLYDPPILGMLLGDAHDPLDVKDLLAFHDFDKNTSDDFLSRLLETIFQIWGDSAAYLGYMPYFLIKHFLQKGRNLELMKKFLIWEPSKWLEEYWPTLKRKFNATQ